MPDRPTLSLSNWSSHRTPGHHGPGRKLCGMASPREWEFGDGTVPALAPTVELLRQMRRGQISFRQYMVAYVTDLAELLREGALAPDALRVADSTWWHRGHQLRDPEGSRWAQDGDTILCSCARPGSPKRRHTCHLELAADVLVRAGWDVIIYGRRITLSTPQLVCPSCGPGTEVRVTRRTAACTSCARVWDPMLSGVIYADTRRRYVRSPML